MSEMMNVEMKVLAVPLPMSTQKNGTAQSEPVYFRHSPGIQTG